MTTLLFVTGNKGKVKECQQLLDSADITIKQHPVGYAEIQTNSLEKVVQFGLQELKNKISQPYLIEDAGLFINHLQGFPGVYSKYVYYTIGLEGVLRLLEDVSNRSAVFRSVYGLGQPKQPPRLFIGETKGTITDECMGAEGFGYDPLFKPKSSKKTFAQMSIDEKNKYSHRGKALQKVIDYFQKKPSKCSIR